MTGSFNTHRESVRAAGTKEGIEYLVNYSNFSSDGFRTQSGSNKRMATAKLGVKISDDTKLTTLVNWFDQEAKDPGGLVRIGTSAIEPGALPGGSFYDPTGTTRGALTNNTRVIRSNQQVGFNLEKLVDTSNTLNVIAYGGQRNNLQYLSTTNKTAPQANDGRASSIDRTFYGTDIRWTNKGELLSKPYQLTAGLNYGYMSDDRLDKNTSNGVVLTSGTIINRDENQSAKNVDQYVQGMWSFDPKWDLHAGVRHTRLNLDITRNQNVANTPQGGSVAFDKTIPVVGLVFKVEPTWNVYANLGRGFETPTLTEVTYASAGSPSQGSNLTIKPATSTNIEVGTKWLVSDSTRLNAAAFNIDTENEIVVKDQKGTTASYTNAGKTKRRGLELSFETALPSDFSIYGAYTLLDARFSSDYRYQTLTGNNNTPTNVDVKSGNYIPGTYRMQFYGELAWKHVPTNFQTAVEARYNSKAFVNDVNTPNEFAPSYTVISVRASLKQKAGAWQLTEYARIDNLFDKAYIGSVRVNDSNSRFYEPAPGRNWIVGIKANYAF